ncbi:MAG: SH3 domain-containing protein [Verrucomicrobia bacterium]|nr:SH3 domain-containing protein [Verrucomicrobiota bacterium]MBS0635899.1 SH3 domain-containing protein [Verrucomicrobiota bacterium]
MRLAILLASLAFTPFVLADQPASQSSKRFEPFTGKVTGHNVRMRLQPNLDAQVYKELDRDDLVLVTGIVDDFYACMPPKGLKGYIFRTYVLDGVVEGSNVFVRLGPDRSSPSVAQLNSGDTVKGTIASQNNKWLQIDLPEDVRFYVSKDYVQRAGDEGYYARQETRKADAMKTLTDLEAALDAELQKPFHKIQLATISEKLNQFIKDNKDMPQAVAQAETLISHMQQLYLNRSVASNDEPSTPQPPVKSESVKQEGVKSENVKQDMPVITPPAPAKPVGTLSWQQQEDAFLAQNGHKENAQAYYAEEQAKGTTLHGTIKPYNSFVSTRPGDYVLLNLKTNLPIAYLYSTKADLSKSVNKPVTIWVSERPNNNFAFPAYFVLQVEE